MKRSARALWCLAIAIAIAAAPVAAAADTGMEGLWTGEDMGGEFRLVLGGGGAFIDEHDGTRQAGTYLLEGEQMKLFYADGSERDYAYGFSEGVLDLTSEETGEQVTMQRKDMEVPKDLVGVWTMQEEGGSVTSPGMVGMDAWGKFFLVYDLATGECEKGVYLLSDEEDGVTISFDAGMAYQMGMEVAGDLMTLTDRDSGQIWTLEKFTLEAK